MNQLNFILSILDTTETSPLLDSDLERIEKEKRDREKIRRFLKISLRNKKKINNEKEKKQ